jgi:hypothetical protein
VHDGEEQPAPGRTDGDVCSTIARTSRNPSHWLQQAT